MVKVKLFGGIAEAAEGKKEFEVSGSSVMEVLATLGSMFGDKFKERVFDAKGTPRAFINVYVNNKDVRFEEGFETKIKDSDEVLILPAIGGG